jgi:CubicO group peptidase (beta-lactamase class C family)
MENWKLKLEIMRLPLIVIAIILLSGCMKDDPMNKPFESFVPREINDGLIISTPSAEGIDPEKLASVYRATYADDNLWSLRSMLVFRNGKLVSESYFKEDNDITNPHLIWSCTKQVMGILAGIALNNGTISSLDATLSELLPGELLNHPEKSAITIQQLLTMHSGIDYNNDGVAGQTDKVLRQIPPDITSFVLSRPMRADPGTGFYYNDGDPQLLSAIIQSAAGEPTDLWADDVFFSKIGVSNYNWVRYKDGTTLGGFGIETTPREIGKIALCVANNGNYNNQQIVPAEWITEMTATQVEISDDYSFGYYWWVDTPRDIHFMWGHGGQFAFIVPAEDLIVVMTSIPNTQGMYQVQADEALPIVDEIIDACF